MCKKVYKESKKDHQLIFKHYLYLSTNKVPINIEKYF